MTQLCVTKYPLHIKHIFDVLLFQLEICNIGDSVTVYSFTHSTVQRTGLKQCFSLHPDTTPPQPNHNVTPTHIEPEQYNL